MKVRWKIIWEENMGALSLLNWEKGPESIWKSVKKEENRGKVTRKKRSR